MPWCSKHAVWFEEECVFCEEEVQRCIVLTKDRQCYGVFMKEELAKKFMKEKEIQGEVFKVTPVI